MTAPTYKLTDNEKRAIYQIAHDKGIGPVRMGVLGSFEWKLPARYNGRVYVVHARFTARGDCEWFEVFPRDEYHGPWLPDEVTPQPEDFEVVRDLVAKNAVQLSSKYRLVGLPPEDKTALECLREVDPDLVARWEADLEERCLKHYLVSHAEAEPLHRELTTQQWTAWRRRHR